MPAGTGDHSVQPGCVGTALAHWHRGTSTGTLAQCTGAAGCTARGAACRAAPAHSPVLGATSPAGLHRPGTPPLGCRLGVCPHSPGLGAVLVTLWGQGRCPPGCAEGAAPRAAPPAVPVHCVSVPVLAQRCQWARAVATHPGCTLWSPVPAGMAQGWLLSVGTALEQLVQNPYQSARLAHQQVHRQWRATLTPLPLLLVQPAHGDPGGHPCTKSWPKPSF